MSTTSEPQAVTILPVRGANGLELALPLGAKLTGAEVTWTVFRLGFDDGVVSCARQRIPCTVSRKFRASLGRGHRDREVVRPELAADGRVRLQEAHPERDGPAGGAGDLAEVLDRRRRVAELVRGPATRDRSARRREGRRGVVAARAARAVDAARPDVQGRAVDEHPGRFDAALVGGERGHARVEDDALLRPGRPVASKSRSRRARSRRRRRRCRASGSRLRRP